jgi:3-oxoacyl-[acyl-carrier protein] reductase
MGEKMNLTDKVALVTGSGRGIGKAIALRLADAGACVVINDVSDAAENTAQELISAGKKSLFVKADITSSAEVNLMVEKIVGTFGRIDILVNNAGITRDKLSLQMSDDEWDAVLNVNLKGVFLCTRAVLKYMLKQRWGRIVNISSISGIVGNPGQVNYCAAKAGIIGITRTVSKEVASRKITVNAVAPGFIETDMTQKIPEKIREEFNKRIPAGFFGSPRDVADAVAFLASDEARYITGQVLCVDGGMVTT